MLGTVNHECALTPSLSSIDARTSYQALMRERQRKATEPKRTLRRLDVDQGTANMLASGMGLAGVRGRVSTFVVRSILNLLSPSTDVGRQLTESETRRLILRQPRRSYPP